MISGPKFLFGYNFGYNMKVEPSEYQALPLRAHAFLEGVPVHDVWRIRLEGGGPEHGLHTLDEFFAEGESMRANGIVAFLFRLRYFLGRVFGWEDDAPAAPPPSSFTHKINEDDRARSRRDPGSFQGPFRLVYDFENESLGEIINKTVHAFLLQAMFVREDGTGHDLYWIIFVRETGAFTRFYMKLIQPFRRYLVYPAMIKKLRQYWRRTTGPVGRKSSPGEK